ncbi:hypothetical protein MASR1M68_03570 [Elusimicrobiota bacterium]
MRKLKDNMYPVCTILYKKDKSDGWYYACMSGEVKVCEKKCKELKEKNNWYDFKCYESSRGIIQRDIEFRDCLPEARNMHMTTDLIYCPQEKKWYYPNEFIPYPNNLAKTINKFEIIVKGEGEDDEYLWAPEDEDDFENGTDVIIHFKLSKNKIVTIADDLIIDIPKFIERLKKDSYSNLTVEEYNYTKFLAWEIEDKIRLIIQSYDYADAVITFDKLIPTKLFYKTFDSLYKKLKYYINRKAQLYSDFKKQEKFLHSLKWKYSKELVDEPQEYTMFDWAKNKIKDLKAFAEKINQNAKKSNKKLLCFHTGQYKYWLKSDECIVRSYSSDWKIKDIVRFVKSANFEYKKGITLSDVYKQFLAKGFNNVIDCKFNNKEVTIYANGEAESTEASQKEIKKLEQIIKNISKKFNDKSKFNVSKLVCLLQKYKNINSFGFRDGIMKL